MKIHFIETRTKAVQLSFSLEGPMCGLFPSDGPEHVKAFLEKATGGTLILNDFDDWPLNTVGIVMAALRLGKSKPENVIVCWSQVAYLECTDLSRLTLWHARRKAALSDYVKELPAESMVNYYSPTGRITEERPAYEEIRKFSRAAVHDKTVHVRVEVVEPIVDKLHLFGRDVWAPNHAHLLNGARLLGKDGPASSQYLGHRTLLPGIAFAILGVPQKLFEAHQGDPAYKLEQCDAKGIPLDLPEPSFHGFPGDPR